MDSDYNLDIGQLNAQLKVKIGGKVYWQINEDTQMGVGDMNVTILSSDETTVNESIATDAEGLWSLYVPILDQYNVTVMKDGFETVYYVCSTTDKEHPLHLDLGNAPQCQQTNNYIDLFRPKLL